MRRSLGVSLLAAILVAGLVAAIALVATSNANDRRTAVPAAAEADDSEEADGGGGPPPWSHADGEGKARADMARRGNARADQAWKEAWRQLTPAQREQKMAELVRVHEQGMKEFGECVAAAGDDSAKRAECEKPLPPGLAKKLLTP